MILLFLIMGGLVVFVMWMFGEMVCVMLVVGLFYEYVWFVFGNWCGFGRMVGFLIGWMYWYFWVIVVVLEVVVGVRLI